jgi:two-component sensor histidine kinase
VYKLILERGDSSLKYLYNFVGYRFYPEIRNQIEEKLLRALADEDDNFLIAIDEAVCNATKYSVCGTDNAEVRIQLKIEEAAVEAKIESKTNPFNACEQKEKLQHYAKTKGSMDWQDVWEEEEKVSGRGFWLMLSACDYLLVTKDGTSVILHTPRPHGCYQSTIENIVSRFFVIDQGVII